MQDPSPDAGPRVVSDDFVARLLGAHELEHRLDGRDRGSTGARSLRSNVEAHRRAYRSASRKGSGAQ